MEHLAARGPDISLGYYIGTSQSVLCLTLPPLAVTADDLSDKGDSDQIMTVFQSDQGKRTIDVYWIADDGGDGTIH